MSYTLNLDPQSWKPPSAGGRPRLPREHGSERGYQQHRTHREPPCGRCLLAHQVRNTSQKSRG